MFRLIWALFRTAFFIIVLGLIFHQFTAKFFLTLMLRRSLGVPVEAGSASVDFLRAELVFRNVEIWNPEDFPPGVMIYIRELRMDSELSTLFENGLHFRLVELEIDSVKLFRSPSGQLNYFQLRNFQGKPSGLPALFHTDSFILTMGKADFYDDGRSSRENHVDVDLRRMAYRNVKTLSDIIEIVGWETLKKLRETDLAKGYLDRIRGELDGADLNHPLDEPRAAAWR